jgi:TolA-binding protein
MLAENPDSLYPKKSVTIIKAKQKPGLLFITLTITLSGCSSAELKPSMAEPGQASSLTTTQASPVVDEGQKIFVLLEAMNSRLQTLEAKLTSLNDKLDARFQSSPNLSAKTEAPDSNEQALNSFNQASRSNLQANSANPSTPSLATAGIISHPIENTGILAKSALAAHDPDGDFINDDAVQIFRKAMILLQGQKHPEAVLAFSSFLEKYPDHALAGSAQFHIGEAYMKQKEYKLALKEFQRVLTSYDRSTHISNTLKEMAIAEDILKSQTDAAKHRQLLGSLFPQSPAASALSGGSTEEAQPSAPQEARAQQLDNPNSTESVNSSIMAIPPTAPLVDKESLETKP